MSQWTQRTFGNARSFTFGVRPDADTPVFSGTAIGAYLWVAAYDLTTLFQAVTKATPVTTTGQAIRSINNKGSLSDYWDQTVSGTDLATYQAAGFGSKPSIRMNALNGFLLKLAQAHFGSFSFLYAGKLTSGSIVGGNDPSDGLQIKGQASAVVLNADASVSTSSVNFGSSALVLGITYNSATGRVRFFKNGAFSNEQLTVFPLGPPIVSDFNGCRYLGATAAVADPLGSDFGEMALVKSVLSDADMLTQMDLLNQYWRFY